MLPETTRHHEAPVQGLSRNDMVPPAMPHSAGAASAVLQPSTPKMKTEHVNFFYGKFQALHDVSLEFASNKVTALIGPSGCGKSTFLRMLNRINETLRDTHLEGSITLDG